MSRLLILPLALFALGGCEGVLLGTPLEGPPPPVDGGPGGGPGDGGPSGPNDAGPIPPGADAGDGDAGTAVDSGGEPIVDAGADAGASDLCDGRSCPAGASCAPETGRCECGEGLVWTGGDCVTPSDGDPAGRTVAEVCDAWSAGHAAASGPMWVAGAGDCDPGTLTPEGIDAVLRRTNMYRWLAGLPPVTDSEAMHESMMDCAVMMNAAQALSHGPSEDWPCYTAAGRSGAASANLALTSGPAAAINQFITEQGAALGVIGHRQWILSPRLGRVGIGYSSTRSGWAGMCLGVFDSTGSSSRPWTAYPSPGPAPIETAREWSFHGSMVRSGSSVRVVRLSDGAELEVEVRFHGSAGSRPPALGWSRNGWSPAAGERYRITILETSEGDIEYETHLVSC